jgi:hypothetical protein
MRLTSNRWCRFIQCPIVLAAGTTLVISAMAGGGPGQALSFNGNNQFVVVTNSPALNVWPMTVTAWIKTSQSNSSADLFFKEPPLAGVPLWYFSHFNGTLNAGIQRNTALVQVNGAGTIANDTWRHVAFTASETGAALYVDGVLNGTGAWTGTPGPANTSLDLFIGIGFQGAMDEITLWNAELTAAEIQAIKNRRLTGTEAGLVAYYRCDETGGLTLFDSAPTGGSQNGTLVNGPTFLPSDIVPFSPAVETLAASVVGAGAVILNGAANPAGTNTSAWFEWGLTTNYGSLTPPQSGGSSTTITDFSQIVLGLAPVTAHHYRAVASNSLGVAFGSNQIFLTLVPGDLDGDGIVNEFELNTVLTNYWPHSPWLQLTNIAGLGGTNVTFALTNATTGAFSVEYTTNLADWLPLGPATPRYEFNDPNAPTAPQRYYRLRWPGPQ